MAVKNPHFYFPFNFGALPHELADYDKSKVVIFPVPYDGTTSYKPGTRDGPHAIIDASRVVEFYDEEAKKNFSEIGICTLDELEILDDAKKTIDRVYEATKKLLEDNKKFVMLGGEHSLTSGAVRAFKEKFSDLSVLHIDAHADMADLNGDSKWDHGCVARRVHEMCLVVLAGIRSLDEEQAKFIEKENIPTYFAHETLSSNDDSWMDDAISKLSKNVYLTIDLDALDPSIMPSVGTPVPGGFQWFTLLKFLRKLKEKNVVGFDVMEFMPIPGMHSPDFTAAKLVYKLIGEFYCK
ncbi:agmatinase [Candidatus Woesearchaeota archaeon]|nr:agmatinase [Candidatus Woesearchaeota archaeon]|tara:strand:- start:20735 stop:21619 length:885 start_codon:yes stop_codon:yes gene_type:complete